MQPTGLLSIQGVSFSGVFFRDLLDRWGVRPLFFARHEYKTVINIVTERGFNRAHREATEAMLRQFSAHIVQVCGVSSVKCIVSAAACTERRRRPCCTAGECLPKEPLTVTHYLPPTKDALTVTYYLPFTKEAPTVACYL
jgi:Peptidase family S49